MSLDFQMLGAGEFDNENTFALSFARLYLRALKRYIRIFPDECREVLEELSQIVKNEPVNFRLQRLFEYLSDICDAADRPMVLMIDEVDSAKNNRVFLDFLSQIRAYYIRRTSLPAFQSVILAGVYDVKNLKRKFRHSPWNMREGSRQTNACIHLTTARVIIECLHSKNTRILNIWEK